MNVTGEVADNNNNEMKVHSLLNNDFSNAQTTQHQVTAWI
jgi:hypothetical protein